MRRFLPATIVLLTAACGGTEVETTTETIYRDVPVDLVDTEWTPPVEGDPAVTVGVTEDQLFRELKDGDDAPIIEGFQGGYWVHVSVRTTGLGRSGKIDGLLELDGEADAIGQLNADLRLTPTREGFYERPQVPISLSEAWQVRFADLFDRSGTIGVTFTDAEGRVGTRDVQVVFVQN